MKNLLWAAAALALSGQWLVSRFLEVHLPLPFNAILPGLGIFGAAFLLSWAAELAQLEVPQALALAILALIAVLPEYAVDIYFAWTAGKDPAYIPYATANMTGANRLLVGIGWPAVLFAYWISTRKRQILLDQAQGIEIAILLMATIYSFIIPLKKTLSLLDTVILVALFGFYIILTTKAQHVEPELEGPSRWISTWGLPLRRLTMVGFFLLAGLTIFVAAEPFAEGLLEIGRSWGIEEFILVQWLAPLASESPEFIVAILFALRANAGAALGTLISSKVNQWTLLIGMLPLAFCISGGRLDVMHLDSRQVGEIFLTSAQSCLAVAVLANFNFSLWEAVTLLVLFSTQLMIPSLMIRTLYAAGYMLLTFLLLLRCPERRQAVCHLLLTAWRPIR